MTRKVAKSYGGEVYSSWLRGYNHVMQNSFASRYDRSIIKSYWMDIAKSFANQYKLWETREIRGETLLPHGFYFGQFAAYKRMLKHGMYVKE